MSELRQPPGPREWEGDATTTGISADSTVDRLELLIVGRNGVVRHPLGEIERLRIGRSKLADIRVDDHSISRQHAIL